MRVLVTGAAGFVGRALVQRLLHDDAALGKPVTALVALDRQLDAAAWHSDARVRAMEGDFGDGDTLARALAEPPQIVFHLASVPGSLAEREPALGLQANLLAPIALLQRLEDEELAPRVVFASSVAVYGALPVEGAIDESQVLRPKLSYGTHKRMVELLLADASRRGVLDGISLRLPGIVARPPQASGHGSAFMSDLIRRAMDGEPYTCPVSPGARAWWMSLPCCIDNLLHAARMQADAAGPERVIQLPVITATVAEVAATIEALRGHPADLQWRPDESIEALFGRMPELHTSLARKLGYTDDGTLQALVQRAVATPPGR
jgi:D-erythronate 2-dehydrogenase